jgi:hypothetical protein
MTSPFHVLRRPLKHCAPKGSLWIPLEPFVGDIVRVERDEESRALAIVYVVFNKITDKVKKAGSTKNFQQRKQLSRENFVIGPDDVMKGVCNLDLMTSKMDQTLQECHDTMMTQFIAHPQCPLPLQRVFEAYLHRGGANLGFKKNIILQMVELGAKIYFGAPIDFELLMFDQEVYDERQKFVLDAWKYVRPILQEVYGEKVAPGQVTVKFGSSWKPGGCDTLKDGSFRLLSKPVAMESIAGGTINMNSTDMVNVPAYPNAKHKSEMFSTKGYTKEQLNSGMEKFYSTVRSLEDYDFLDLDTCKFLFEDDPRGSLHLLLRLQFRIRLICWNFEHVLLVHATKKVVIWLHLPYCKGAPGQRRPIESVVKRNLAIQLSKLVIAWCQGEPSRAEMDGSFHDATLAAFAYEHAVVAIHTGPMQAAACQRDILTDKETYALLQNDLYNKHPNQDRDAEQDQEQDEEQDEEPGQQQDLPVAANVRKELLQAESDKRKNRKFDLNSSVIRRAVNVLRSIRSLDDVKAAVHNIQAIFREDNANYKAHSKRWGYVFEALKEDSALIPALNGFLPKQNTGNTNSTGISAEKQARVNADLQRLKSLALDVKFWVRKNDNTLDPPNESEMRQHGSNMVFTNLTFGGTKNHFHRIVQDPNLDSP